MKTEWALEQAVKTENSVFLQWYCLVKIAMRLWFLLVLYFFGKIITKVFSILYKNDFLFLCGFQEIKVQLMTTFMRSIQF